MPTTLSNSPPEIISHIAWHLVGAHSKQHHLTNAISSLSPLFLVSKHIYAALSPGHALSYSNGQRYPLQTELYARLCEAYIDVAAVKRRWWGRLRGPTTSALTAHFINVVRTLSFYQRSMRILRSVNEKDPMLPFAQTVYAPTVPLHLATTMLLCLEHDSKNMGLLFGVEAHMFIQMLMLRRLGEGRDENDLGWLVENIFNTLSLWCFWYVSSGRETLESETLSMREWVVNLILPFVVTPFRYASALSPPTHFTLPVSNLSARPPAVTWTAHGAYPLYYTREHPYSGYAIPPFAMQQQQQQQQQQEQEAAAGAAQTQAPQHLAGTPQDRSQPHAHTHTPHAHAPHHSRPPHPRQSSGPAPPPQMPTRTGPRPTPVNSHLHPSTGIHVFWYSSMGLWRAERERVHRRLVHSPTVPLQPRDDRESTPTPYNAYAPLRILLPPASIPAKLIYLSRREMKPPQNPDMFPPVQAPAPQVAVAAPLQPAVRLGPRPTQPDILEVSNFRIAKIRGYASEADDMPEATSREYDTEWARMVLCWRMAGDGQASSWDSENCRALQWRNGRVYERGMLTGLWQGRMYVPADSTIAFLAGTRDYPGGFVETALGLGIMHVFVRFAEHGKVRVPGADNSPVPAPAPLTALAPPPHQTVFADENMNNAWIEGRTGSLVWEYGGGVGEAARSALLVGGMWGDGSTRDAIVERHRKMEAGTSALGELKETMKMKSVALCVPDLGHAASSGSEEGAVMRKYVYETYEKGGECAHDRLERAQNVRSVRAVDADGNEHFYVHPGCLRCREKERLVEVVREKEEREKGEWKRQARLKEEMLARERQKREEERLVVELAEDMAERMFASHGLGMDEGAEMEGEDKAMKEVVSVELGSRRRTRGGWSPIASHSGSPHHSRHTSSSGDEVSLDEAHDPLADYTFNASHLPFCDDGVEDTLITGTVDERHENAWGRFVCYGRVRPWDGLVGFVRLQILPPDVADGEAFVPLPPSAKFFFYGYIHAGKTIVGNWRYTGIEAVSATVESAFMISRKED
ncbi:hypothetical protein BKA70DRAFT_1185677 [Coprinopsis sp. MPI-PUGE-AT-0042]|nr:hypothetical protein BKA70DRAFT_1185677 [Coprinopsis sp. MPI-PUGE-AT-0042]